MYVYKSAAESGVTNTAYRVISLVAQDHAVAEGGEAPVSACKPLCAILLRKPSVYPLSPVKANVGRLCEELKNALKSGLEQRCNSNFLAIFVEVILWFFDRLRKAPALLAPEPSLSLTSQVQRKF